MNNASPATIPLLELEEQERALGILAAGKVTFPLAGVDIKAKVVDRVCNVTIKQVFRNSFSEHLEAVYIFPLAAGCAVASFDMKVGDRVVKGVVQERAQARQAYQQAISDGKRAALMEQERDDVFTVQVGNIPPGEEITVEITYSERLPFFDDGKTELRLPLVVSPRYIPGAAVDRDQVGDGTELDTDQVPDASRITPPRLAPGLDPQIALKLEVELLTDDESGTLCDLSCSQHATRMSLANGDLSICLAKNDERLNRDFVLRWTMTAKTLKSTLLAYKAEDGQTYGMLSILPPAREGFLGTPRDVVFVLDRSGSMNGIKMISAVRACSILANTLSQRDRFAILAFDDRQEWMPVRSARGGHGDRFIHADEAGLEQAETYLRTITARGGTEMDGAISQALGVIKQRARKEGRTVSLVVLTDGEVGNESSILQRVQRELGDARVFAVGIDTSVNAGLLKRLAALGGGTAAFVEPGIQLEEALASVARDIGHPLVSDLQVEGLDLAAIDRASISPSRIPDTFAGKASIAFLKLKDNNGRVLIKGKYADGKPFEQKVKIRKTDVAAVAQLWAKAHIVELEDQYRISQNRRTDLKEKIVALAVKHSLLTKFTAFVVVDEAEIVNKTGDIHKVVQPVEMPDQWEMEQQKQQNLPAAQRSSLMGQLTKSRQASAPAPGSAAGGAAGRAKSIISNQIAEASGGSIAKKMSVARDDADDMLATSTHLRSLSKMDDRTIDKVFSHLGVREESQPAIQTGAGPADQSLGGSGQDSGSSWGAPAPTPPISSDEWGSGGGWGQPSQQPASDSWGAPAKPAISSDEMGSGGAWAEEGDSTQTGSWQAFSLEAAPQPSPAPAQAPPPAPAAEPAPPSAPQETVQADASSVPRKKSMEKAAPAPTSPPMPPSGSGSYGSGVRSQVFEVVVRQAIAGAPWKQICAGPMQVNNISEQEVEAEVKRREQLLFKPQSKGAWEQIVEMGKTIFSSKPAAPNVSEKEVSVLKPILTALLTAFTEAFILVEKKEKPHADELEALRQKLIQKLAPLQLGLEMPLMQRFLRSTAIQLIASLKDTGNDADALANYWAQAKGEFDSVCAETGTVLGTALERQSQPFWESSV